MRYERLAIILLTFNILNYDAFYLLSENSTVHMEFDFGMYHLDLVEIVAKQ